jgi:hypothetical protein
VCTEAIYWNAAPPTKQAHLAAGLVAARVQVAFVVEARLLNAKLQHQQVIAKHRV